MKVSDGGCLSLIKRENRLQGLGSPPARLHENRVENRVVMAFMVCVGTLGQFLFAEFRMQKAPNSHHQWVFNWSSKKKPVTLAWHQSCLILFFNQKRMILVWCECEIISWLFSTCCNSETWWVWFYALSVISSTADEVILTGNILVLATPKLTTDSVWRPSFWTPSHCKGFECLLMCVSCLSCWYNCRILFAILLNSAFSDPIRQQITIHKSQFAFHKMDVKRKLCFLGGHLIGVHYDGTFLQLKILLLPLSARDQSLSEPAQKCLEVQICQVSDLCLRHNLHRAANIMFRYQGFCRIWMASELQRMPELRLGYLIDVTLSFKIWNLFSIFISHMAFGVDFCAWFSKTDGHNQNHQGQIFHECQWFLLTEIE